MLVLLAADGTRLDAGSVGLALTRRWADAGAPALFVDADTDGTRLAGRLGQVAFADYSPAARGLPSLIVAREPLTLRLLADHCYSLDTAAGSLWALFAPSHPDGGKHAAQWLAERIDDLATVGRERAVLVASRFPDGAELFASAPWSAAVLVVLAAVPAADAAKELAALCRDTRLSSSRCPHRALIVEGDTAAQRRGALHRDRHARRRAAAPCRRRDGAAAARRPPRASVPEQPRRDRRTPAVVREPGGLNLPRGPTAAAADADR